jgi:ribonuclease G
VGAGRDALASEIAELRGLWRGIEERQRDAPAPSCLHRDVAPLERMLRDHGGDGLRRVMIDSPPALAAARAYCARVLPDLGARLVAYGETEPLFERLGVEAALDEALGPRVALSSGGVLVIEETEALTAVDVNVAGAAGGADAGATALRTNLEAAGEIARQLRLRAIGGLIVVDFVRMESTPHRRRVIEALAAAFADDRAADPPTGFTALGLVEMTRRRSRPSLADVMCDPSAVCAGRGRRKSPASVALDIARAVERAAAAATSGPLTVIAAPEVAAALEGPATGVLAALAESLGRPVAVRADAGFEREAHDIVAE